MKRTACINYLLILPFCGFVILLSCIGDYNPFEDPANSEVLITGMTFAPGDTLEIFTAETIMVMLAVREKIDYFKVMSPGNRLFNGGEVIRRAQEGKTLSSGPYRFVFSFSDTGANSINFITGRTNGQQVFQKIDFYIRSPLSQSPVSGSFGEEIRLSTPGVRDRDVFYLWDFRMGTVVKSSVSDTNVILHSAGADGVGTLRVSDGYFSSPAVPFAFILSDNTPPRISFIQDNYIISGNTIRTAETAFFFSVSIKDRGPGRVDSASINGKPFDIIAQDSLYIKVFDRLDTLKNSIPVRIYALDNPENRNDTTINLWLLYDPEVRKGAELNLSILVPPSDTILQAVDSVRIMGTVSRYAGDPIEVKLRINIGNETDTFSVKGTFEAAWSRIVELKEGANNITITALDQDGKSIVSASRVIIYNPGQKDNVAPVILETTAGGSDARLLTVSGDTVVLKVIAFDEGSGIDSLTVNGKRYLPEDDYLWKIRLPLFHLPEGNRFYIRAVDRSGNDVRDTLLIFENSPPVVETPPRPPLPMPAGNIYRDSIIVRDPDNDPVKIRLISGDPSMVVGEDGSIFWDVDSAKIGLHEFVIYLYDGYQSVVHRFKMMVVDSSDLRESVKFTIRENDFPKFVETGSVFRKFLETDTSRGARPYQFSAWVMERKRELNFSGDTLLWMPLSSDTGLVHLKIVVTDTFLTSDTLYPSILVVPPNRPLKLELLNLTDTTSAGAIDLSDSSGSVTLDFHIDDPDTDLAELFTASVIRRNRSDLLEINKERNFSISLFSSEMPSGYDTVLVKATDRSGHSDICSLVVYYGTAPEPPGEPFPSDGSVVNDSVVNFSWQGGDRDGFVFYSLSASFCPEPSEIATGLQTQSFTSEVFNRSGQYCWKVTASDGKSVVEGPVWTFYLRLPGHVQIKTESTAFASSYEALQDSIIVPLSIVDGTGKGPLKWKAYFSGSGSSVPVVNGTVRYFPQTADTGLQKLIITVTDSVGNSDTLIPVILVRPPLELGLTMNFSGKYTDDGAIDLSDSVDPVKIGFLLTERDPDTVRIFQRNTQTIAKADSAGMITMIVNPMVSGPVDDTLRIVVVDYPDILDTSFVIHYGSPPSVPSNPVPSDDSLSDEEVVTLSWECSDPDGNDVTFDLYFGETGVPVLLAEGLTSNSYTFENAWKSGTYYWKVVARDRKSSSESPVWTFIVDSRTTEIRINTTSSGAAIYKDIYDIPVLVRLDNTNFDFSEFGPDGDKAGLSFTRKGAPGKLPYQIDYWERNQAGIWVLLDTLKGNDDSQVIRMSWGEGYENGSDGTKVFDVEKGFVGVWHLEESRPATGNQGLYQDATANGYHGDDMVNTNTNDGLIGRGQYFGVAGMSYDWIRIPGNNNMGSNSSQISMETWFNVTTAQFFDRVFLSLGTTGTFEARFRVSLTSDWRIVLSARSSSPNTHSMSTDALPVSGGWHHLYCSVDYDADSMHVYLDGTLVRSAQVNLGDPLSAVTTIAAIGGEYNGMSGTFYGTLDEMRFSHARRTPEWIKFCFENQKADSKVVQAGNR